MEKNIYNEEVSDSGSYIAKAAGNDQNTSAKTANNEQSNGGKTNWLQKLKRSWNRWLTKRRQTVAEDIVPYRRMALQLIHDKSLAPNLLMVSSSRDNASAHSCVLLSMALSSVLKRSIIIIDISVAGSIIPDLLGCTSRGGESEGVNPQSRKPRFFENDEGWFFNTREGVKVGPFLSLKEAKLELEVYIENDLFDNAIALEKQPSEFIMQTKSKNIDYLSAVSAGLHGSLESMSDQQANDVISNLIYDVRSKYEYVVFFGGYLLDCPTGLKVAPHAGKVILSSTENKTSQDEYRDAVKTLRLCSVEHFSNMLVKISGKAASSGMRAK